MQTARTPPPEGMTHNLKTVRNTKWIPMLLIAELEANYDINEGAEQHLAIIEPKTGVGYRPAGPDDRLWMLLKEEVYILLCENSRKYKRERNALRQSVAPAVGLLSSMLTSKFGMEAGAASGMAAVALLIPLKVSLNAWFVAMKDRRFTTFKDQK